MRKADIHRSRIAERVPQFKRKGRVVGFQLAFKAAAVVGHRKTAVFAGSTRHKNRIRFGIPNIGTFGSSRIEFDAFSVFVHVFIRKRIIVFADGRELADVVHADALGIAARNCLNIAALTEHIFRFDAEADGVVLKFEHKGLGSLDVLIAVNAQGDNDVAVRVGIALFERRFGIIDAVAVLVDKRHNRFFVRL